MSWSTSNRRQRLPSNWPDLTRRVLQRDHHTCRINGPRCTTTATEADHIRPGDDHTLANLQAACHTCHGEKTAREGHQAMRAIRARTRHHTERHPGLT